MMVLINGCITCDIYDALRSALKLPESTLIKGGQYQYEYQQSWDEGYNQALADVKQAIEWEVK